MNNEIWKDVFNYEGTYQVSNTGKVRSLDRETKIDTEKRSYIKINKSKVLKQVPDKDGYLMVGLHLFGNAKTFKVHRLVAIHFHLNPENKPQVNHKDGDKTNNNDWNVEWATDVENKKHANETGLSRYLTGKDHRLTGTDGNNNKWVIDTATGEKFSSIKKASVFLKMGKSNLEKQLSGKYKNKTTLKYL